MKYSSKERRNSILEELHQQGRIDVKECAKKYEVSEVSIRTDMEYLERKGLLIRVKGGAISRALVTDEEELLVEHKAREHSQEKKAIGKAAAALISEGETIILDSGTTTLEVAKCLGGFKDLTIITNGVNIAMELAKYPQLSVIMLGGYMRSQSLSITGMNAESTLKDYYVDKLFLGVDSISLDKGLSTPSADEASINRTMIECSKEVIAVFDSSKFNKRSFANICQPSTLGTVVTDEGISKEAAAGLVNAGVRIIAVKVDQ